MSVHDHLSFTCLATCMQGLGPDTTERLPRYTITAQRISVRACEEMDQADHPAAFTSVLQQLQSLRAPGAVVAFHNWSWQASMLSALLDALPSLRHLNFNVKAVSGRVHS